MTNPLSTNPLSTEPTRAERRQRRRVRLRRILISLGVTAALLAGLGIAANSLWQEYGDAISERFGWTTNDYVGTGEGEVVITIRSGDVGGDVANTLAEAGVVKTSKVFYELLLAQSSEVEFHPGSFKLKQQMSAQAALDALQDPENRIALTAVIPEGRTVEQALEIVSAGADIPLEELQAAAKKPTDFGVPKKAPSLEGWIYPATYEFEPDTSAEDAIAKMVGYQLELLDELGVKKKDRLRVITIASIVERESGRAEDYGKVARVIYNRLDVDMLLQMDSTAQYGMQEHESGSVWSSSEALADDNPWNTYVHTGLPKGPIANPGRAAIEATVNPPEGDWLFFAAVNLETGESVFSTTNEEHDRAVQQLHEWCAANPAYEC